ncbi:alpha/beta fold hydrolase [Erythrobacter litoralis]|uniref:Hydrolase, alpha/beta hydrolase fold family protein n=1 Tax=Erythrobacter litoralis (strain HTCC2594) TaxID=314225 RepID=Q2NCM5_ERYLH|nr:alpha/beta hydrolase [Erythrobacter litoralis]ABC62566.1 hydrolase, alpha/beta hydrolase fold family protein [Erythrobacter litoralis HTCC2594]
MKRLLKILAVIVALLVIAFFILRTPDTDPEEMRAKYGTAPSQFVTLANGQELHLRDEGPRDAMPIVLLHGSNADMSTWQPWAEALRNDYRVIRFDQIGHGLTGAAFDEDYSGDRFIESVHLVADRLDLDRFVLAGNSMGGGIAMGFAMRHPERLSGLVLVDAGGAPIRREGGGNLAFTLAQMPVVGNVMSAMLPRSIVERSLKQSVSKTEIVDDAMVDRYFDMARYPGNRAATRARFSQERVPFEAEQVARVTVPTLVMWGEEDSLIPYTAAGWFMEHLPNATLANYPGIGHLPQEEAPERSVADLKAWLAGIAGNEPAIEPA